MKDFIRRIKMLENFLSFGYNQCVRLGYTMGFGAFEGLVIYIGIIALIIVRVKNDLEFKKE